MDFCSQSHGVGSMSAHAVGSIAHSHSSPPRLPRALYIVKPSPDLVIPPLRLHGFVTSLAYTLLSTSHAPNVSRLGPHTWCFAVGGNDRSER
jgi:hypothetical protein